MPIASAQYWGIHSLSLREIIFGGRLAGEHFGFFELMREFFYTGSFSFWFWIAMTGILAIIIVSVVLIISALAKKAISHILPIVCAVGYLFLAIPLNLAMRGWELSLTWFIWFAPIAYIALAIFIHRANKINKLNSQ